MSVNGGGITAGDSFAVGNGRMRNAAANLFVGSATYVTTFSGNATFTGVYRASTTPATCTYTSSLIIVQVLG